MQEGNNAHCEIACDKRDRLDRHMAAAAPVGAPAGTCFLPLVFEVHANIQINYSAFGAQITYRRFRV